MYIVIILLAIPAVCFIIKAFMKFDTPVVIEIIGVVFLCVNGLNAIGVFGTRAESRTFINEFNSLKTTIEDSRKDTSNSLERIAFLQNIADKNSKLADYKYWQRNLLTSWYVVPDIQELTPIK